MLALALTMAGRAAGAPVDFRELLQLSEVYRSLRRDTAEQVRAAWAGRYRELEIVDLPATRNRYLVGRCMDGRQEVVVRGTANVINAVYDAEVLPRWNTELGMRVHRGFDAMARVLYEDLRPRLDRGRAIVLFGHSLGAAEALLLGLLLEHDGYAVRQVYSSGQPKVTDRQGAARYATFAVLRVSGELDPVPFLPPRLASPENPYEQFGREIILLDGPWYAEAQARAENEARSGSVWALIRESGARTTLAEHMIETYLEKLQGKETAAIEAPYEYRRRYLRSEQGP